MNCFPNFLSKYNKMRIIWYEDFEGLLSLNNLCVTLFHVFSLYGSNSHLLLPPNNTTAYRYILISHLPLPCCCCLMVERADLFSICFEQNPALDLWYFPFLFLFFSLSPLSSPPLPCIPPQFLLPAILACGAYLGYGRYTLGSNHDLTSPGSYQPQWFLSWVWPSCPPPYSTLVLCLLCLAHCGVQAVSVGELLWCSWVDPLSAQCLRYRDSVNIHLKKKQARQ